MRRRLWWSLVIFDTRIAEMSDYRTTILTPTWDCKTALNVDDFDLHPETKYLPTVHKKPTEAIFAVVRSELYDFIRHSTYHLDFSNPILKIIAKDIRPGPVPAGGELLSLGDLMEEKYLKYCHTENPLHYMTLWTARGLIAKNRLVENYARFSRSGAQPTDAQRDTATVNVLTLLECDTKLMASPLTKAYHWLMRLYFPFPAYVHIFQDLRRRPLGEHVEKAWEVMCGNYDARFANVVEQGEGDGPLFKMFARTVLQAWEARQAVLRELNQPLELPRMVYDIKRRLKEMTLGSQNNSKGNEQTHGDLGLESGDFSMAMPLGGMNGNGLLYDMGGQSFAELGLGNASEVAGQAAMDFNVDPLGWTPLDWNPMHPRGW
jgi:hypothetical protein